MSSGAGKSEGGGEDEGGDGEDQDTREANENGAECNECSENDPRSDTKKKKKDNRKQEYRLVEPLFTWRRILKDVWTASDSKDDKTELCQSILCEIFDGAENPFETVLTLHKVCPDYNVQKSSSLAGFVVRYFADWLKKNENCDQLFNTFVSYQAKVKAFSIATAKHTFHLSVISDIFDLKHPDMVDYIVNALTEMIAQRNYRDAISCATHFGLQSWFGMEELVIPCMLQDRGTAVEVYLRGHRQMQIELVRYFDSLIGLSDSQVESMFDPYRKERIMTIPMAKLQRKTLEKMVAKMLGIYGVSSDEATPNLMRSRQEGSLKHMAFKRFAEQSVSDDGYTDYVSHALMGDPHLQEFYISHLCYIGQSQEAVRWVVYCDLLDHPPRRVRPFINQETIQCAFEMINQQSAARPMVEGIELFEGHPILMVDTASGLEQLSERLRKASVIGIDSEWKPLFLSTTEQVALIQVAVDDCTYLVDVVGLEKSLSEHEWIEFFKSLLCTDQPVKLGFDFHNDLRVLRVSFPFLFEMQSEMKNVICVVKLVNSLMAENSSLIDLAPNGGASSSTSSENAAQESPSEECLHFRLTDLCEKVLGTPLDKKEQVGNWAIRPLRAEQMRYAAMDAFCLIKVYETLKSRAAELSMNWATHLAESDMNFQKPKEVKKQKRKGMVIDDNEFREMIRRVNEYLLSSSSCETRRPGDVKVLVDSMMLGLGKHLRRCGIDTFLAETRSALIKCAKHDRHRIILTSGKAYNEIRSCRALYGSPHIVCIPGLQAMNAIEQVEFVLKRFHIQLSKEDIFSRCMKCNSSMFVLVPSPVLEAMYQAHIAVFNPYTDVVYDAAKYNTKMSEIVAEDYSGYGCTLSVNPDDISNTIVNCHNGTIDIMKRSVKHVKCKDSAIVQIGKVPSAVLEAKGRFFYVCGDCGKVYWDGCHIANYNAFAESLFADEVDDTESFTA